jgi:hypothetical protein
MDWNVFEASDIPKSLLLLGWPYMIATSEIVKEITN